MYVWFWQYCNMVKCRKMLRNVEKCWKSVKVTLLNSGMGTLEIICWKMFFSSKFYVKKCLFRSKCVKKCWKMLKKSENASCPMKNKRKSESALKNVKKMFKKQCWKMLKNVFFWEFPCWKMLKNVKITMLKNVEIVMLKNVEKCWKIRFRKCS